MTRQAAKAFYDVQAGDPATGYITPADAQAALDVVYDDMAAGDAASAAALNRIGNLLTANQATGTDAEGATTGFFALNNATLATSTDWAASGSRSLKATFALTGTATFGTSDNTSTVVPVTVGETYTGLVVARQGTGTRTVNPRIYWYTAAGAYLSATAGPTVTPSASGTLVSVTGVAPATAAYAGVQLLVGAGAASVDTMYADHWSLHRGAAGVYAPPGLPTVGMSHIATNGAVHLSGTGTPEGVVTAAPGSTWLQTDATTDVKGWIRWVKATGTGNTGWVAGPEADTGWRNVTASNSWSFSTLQLRRVGNIVTMQWTGASTCDDSASSDTFYTIPAGFRPLNRVELPMNRQPTQYWGIGSDGVCTRQSGVTVSSSVYMSATWTTATASDSWPSSLPGSAV